MLPRAGETERTAHQRLRVVRLLRLDELEAHFPLLAKKAAAFRRKSRSIVMVFSSRCSRANSARSCEVSGPLGWRFSSTSARFTQARTAVSVRSSSLATSPMLLPLARTSCTTSALYSLVNFRRFRRSMDSILPHIGGVHSIGASSEAGAGAVAAGLLRGRAMRLRALLAAGWVGRALRRGGTDLGTGQSGRPGQDRPARRAEAGAQLSQRRPDRGLGAGCSARG